MIKILSNIREHHVLSNSKTMVSLDISKVGSAHPEVAIKVDLPTPFGPTIVTRESMVIPNDVSLKSSGPLSYPNEMSFTSITGGRSALTAVNLNSTEYLLILL